jgi:hypothetical protein
MSDPEALRKLAAWYREFAERAGNPVIWEMRLDPRRGWRPRPHAPSCTRRCRHNSPEREYHISSMTICPEPSQTIHVY